MDSLVDRTSQHRGGYRMRPRASQPEESSRARSGQTRGSHSALLCRSVRVATPVHRRNSGPQRRVQEMEFTHLPAPPACSHRLNSPTGCRGRCRRYLQNVPPQGRAPGRHDRSLVVERQRNFTVRSRIDRQYCILSRACHAARVYPPGKNGSHDDQYIFETQTQRMTTCKMVLSCEVNYAGESGGLARLAF